MLKFKRNCSIVRKFAIYNSRYDVPKMESNKLYYLSSSFERVYFGNLSIRMMSDEKLNFSLSQDECVCDDLSANVLNSFSDYGLGGWQWPSQWLHNLMECLHCDIGLPWIPTIMTTCVILRTLGIPFYAKMQAFYARNHNCMPQQMKLQMELSQCTNDYDKRRKNKELMEMMKKNGTNPITQLPFMLPTAIILSSFFASVKKMAEVKLPSLTEGGIFWFNDLTLYDPLYILPIFATLSLHLLVRFGGAASEAGPMADNPKLRKLFLYGPFVFLPFVAWQPSALCVFWMTSNFYSFLLMKIFQQQKVQEYFKIPQKASFSSSQQMIFMKEQQDAMMRAMTKVKRHNDVMKKFADDSKRRRR